MGLLDGLLGQQGGGLLDFLRNNALNQQFSGGLASDQAQYGQPPMQAMAQMPQMAPQSVPAEPAPQMPQQAAPQATQAAPQGLPPALGGISNVLGRIGSPDGLISRLTGNDSQSVKQQNLKAQYDTLVPMLGPQKAMLAVMNPEAGKTLIAQALEKKQYGFTKLDDGSIVNQDPQTGKVNLAYQGSGDGLTNDIKEYQFAKKEDPGLTFEKFMARKKAVSGEYGMTPIWGTGPDGKPAVLQLGKSGDAKQSVLPDGFNLARDPIKVEGPTGTTILDPQTRQQVGFIPKDVAGAQAAEKVGQARGAAQAALANGADVDAEQTKKKIDELLAKKDFDSIFGSLGQFRPSWALSDSGKDAKARFDQLKGTSFLSAYSMLKGGGAITDIEGQKAGAAMARLDRALSEPEARQALNDFKEAVDTGLMKLRRAAAGGETPQAPSGLPSGWSVKVH